MLVLPFTNSFKVSMPPQSLIVIREHTGDLIVMDSGTMRRVAADDAEWFAGLCQNCLTIDELRDYAGWLI